MPPRICTLLLLLASSAFSCQLEGKGDKVGVSEKTVALPDRIISAKRGTASLPLDIWPASTQSIFGLDIAMLRQSPMGALTTAWLRSDKVGLLSPLPSSCQLELVNSIDSMLVIHGFGGSNANEVLAVRGIERVELEKCSPLVIAGTGERLPDGYTAISDDPDKGVVWWMDANTMLFAPTGGRRVIDMARPGGSQKQAGTRSALLQSISRTNTRAALWVVSAPGGEQREDFEELRGWVDLSDGLNASFEVRYETPELSAGAVASFEKNIKMVSPFEKYTENLEVSSEGQWLKLRIGLSRALLDDFAGESLFKMLYPDATGM